MKKQSYKKNNDLTLFFFCASYFYKLINDKIFLNEINYNKV